MTAADAPSNHEFCAFEFPGCEECQKAMHIIKLKMVGSSEDPMKSDVWRGWINGMARIKEIIDSPAPQLDKPSRTCSECGEPMTYFADLPAYRAKTAERIFRCYGCNNAVSEKAM